VVAVERWASENEIRESGVRLPGVVALLAPLRLGKASEDGGWRPKAKRGNPAAALPPGFSRRNE
jgi:hypothetical protein